MSRKPLIISEEQIQNAIENSNSMNQAAQFLKVTYTSFIRYAKKFGLYSPNRGLKGSKRKYKETRNKISLEEIFNNVKQYSTSRLKYRLYQAKIKEAKCEECGIVEWNGKKLSLHLDHIDGNKLNNSLNNLRILCPNCHSQTETYCRGQGKNGQTLSQYK